MWLKRLIFRIQQFILSRKAIKSDKIRGIVYLLQEFYLGKNYSINTEEMFKGAREDIAMLGITNLDITSNKLIIRLQRPGLLIGHHGSNIDALQTFLKDHRVNKMIHIEEEKILSHLLPYEYMDDDF
jgi:ribosomal protein S3